MVCAVLAGVLSVVFGLGGSLQWDTPAGPSVVVAAAALFALSLLAGALRDGLAALLERCWQLRRESRASAAH